MRRAVKLAHRLCSSRHPANSGKGAALYGGRWNPVGTEVIYTSESPSLAVLEILVHDDVPPQDFALTPIQIPDSLGVLIVEGEDLPADSNRETVVPATQMIGERWVRERDYSVLRHPGGAQSCIESRPS